MIRLKSLTQDSEYLYERGAEIFLTVFCLPGRTRVASKIRAVLEKAWRNYTSFFFIREFGDFKNLSVFSIFSA